MTGKQVPMVLLHNSTLGVLKKERNPKNKPHCYSEPNPNLNKKKVACTCKYMPGKIQEHHIKLMCACVYSFYDKSIVHLTFQNKTQEVKTTSLTANIICWQNDTNLEVYIIHYWKWKKTQAVKHLHYCLTECSLWEDAPAGNNRKHSIRMDTEVRPRHKILSIANTFFSKVLFWEHRYCTKAVLLFGGSAPSKK